MSIFNKLFSNTAKEMIDSSSKLIDTISTSDEEKQTLKESMIDMLTDKLNEVKRLQADVLMTEMKGNWLQRSWRPIVMLSMMFVVLVATFTETQLNSVPADFWQLLMIGIGGYIGGRSVEKIASKGIKNIDIPFLKKKDRKDNLS